MAAESNIDIVVRVRRDAAASGVLASIRRDAKRAVGNLTPRGSRGASLFGAANLATAATGVTQLTAVTRQAIGTPLRLAADFEQAITEVRAVTGDAQILENFDTLREKALEIGRATEFTAVEAAQGLKFLGVANRNTAESLESISPIMDAATVSGVALGRTSDLVTDVMGGFGLESDKTRSTVDTLITTTLNANTGLDALGRGLFKVGPLASKTGISLKEASTFMGVLANAGIKGGEGGTVLRNILLSVAGKPTKDMRRALRKLGFSSKELRKELGKSGLEGVTRLLAERTQSLSGPMQLFVSNILFGRRTAAGATEILSKLGTGYAELKTKVDASGGSSKKAAAEFRSTAQAAGKQLTSALTDAGITIGTKLLPVFLPLIADAKNAANAFSEWAGKNEEWVRTGGKILFWVTAIGTVLGPVLLTLSSLGSVVAIGGAAFGIMSTGIGLAVKTVTTLAPVAGKLVALLATPAGLVALAAGAGVAVGIWADETFHISDNLAGLNQEMIIHNQLLEAELGLQVGLSRIRGAALLSDLSEEEQVQLEAAKVEKERLGTQLANIGDLRQGPIDLRQGPIDLTGGDLEQGIRRQQAIIDKLQEVGLKRQEVRETAERFQPSTAAPPGVAPGAGILPTAEGGGPATGVALATQAQAILQQLKLASKVEIEVSDSRVKARDVGGDVPVEITQGLTTE